MSEAQNIPPELRRRIQDDPWAKTLGIEFLDLRRGHCRLRLQLRSHMVIALSVTINYLAAVTPEAVLLAEARELKQGRRAGFYQLSVATEDGRAVAAAYAIAHRVMS